MLPRKNTLQHLQNLTPASVTWAEQVDDLRAMWTDGVPTSEIAARLGRTPSSVLTQAVRIGLERRASSGRKAQSGTRAPKAPPSHTNVISFPVRGYSGTVVNSAAPQPVKKPRTCLMCSTSFQSHGAHNRICNRCKDCASYQTGHDNEYRVLTA